MEQTEDFQYVTQCQLETSVRNRLHVKRTTTAGNSIGPMRLADLTDAHATWQATYKQKKGLYGDNARILPSGRPDEDATMTKSGEKRAPQVRKDGDVEPVTYHGIKHEMWEELMHQAGSQGRLKVIVDLTPLDPTLAMVAHAWKVPYIGICLTEEHRDALRRELTRRVFQLFTNQKSKHYNSEVADLLGTSGPAAKAVKKTKDAVDDEEGKHDDGAAEPQKKKVKKESKASDSIRAQFLGGLIGADNEEPAVGTE